jgi:hypothetical protein
MIVPGWSGPLPLVSWRSRPTVPPTGFEREKCLNDCRYLFVNALSLLSEWCVASEEKNNDTLMILLGSQ